MKYIYLTLVCLGILSSPGCKKNTPEPVIEEEYFSFDANGVHYNYPLEIKEASLFGGGGRTLFAAASTGSLGYFMGGESWKDHAAEGAILFHLYGGFPSKDTILLGIDGKVSVERFLNQDAYYSMIPPYGKIIFTERSSERLTGIFEFHVELYNFPTFRPEVDTVIQITNGKFSIIPAK